MNIKEIKLDNYSIGSDIMKCDKYLLQYLLEGNTKLRAVGEAFLNEDEDFNDEVDSIPTYERVVHKYVAIEDKVLGINYHDNVSSGGYFDADSLENYEHYYVYDTSHYNFKGGIYTEPFESIVDL